MPSDHSRFRTCVSGLAVMKSQVAFFIENKSLAEVLNKIKFKYSNQDETKAKQGCQSANSHNDRVNSHSEHAYRPLVISHMCK